MRALVLLPLLLGCSPGVICGEGFVEVEGGECVPEDAGDTDLPDDPIDTDEPEPEPGIEDVIIADQECARLPAGERLDLIGGCADGVCARDPWPRVREIAGPPMGCEPMSTERWFQCRWRSGLAAGVYDVDDNGEVGAQDIAWFLNVRAPWGGASPEGLGVGAAPSCFVADLGAPSQLSLMSVKGDRVWLMYAYWRSLGVIIYDQEGGPDPYTPDGRVDSISLYGPPDQGG